MKQIQLTQGRYTTVDDCDYEYLLGFSWHYHAYSRKGGYASYTTPHDSSGKQYTVKMHHLIADRMGVTRDEKKVDHADGNQLNNCRYNLRLATQSQNLANRGLDKNNTSGYKGVCFQDGRWRAAVRSKGKRYHLGYFDSKLEAAKAYNKAALEVFGDFARLNVL